MESQHLKIADVIRRGGRNSPLHKELINIYRAERAVKKNKHLEAACRSLDELIKYSNGRTVFCLENRYRFEQIPNIEDMDYFFQQFGDELIRYWHDVGHAHTQQHLGLLQENFPIRFGNKLAGKRQTVPTFKLGS